ncbi:hypothetical protein LSTR_LSTR012095 [Laodelphax striatellus]|uniref:Uncharacterized protein n=1 Tax=Laodelphax striatellus TaxID=195883 RepID=A0A482X214_LAOST|nr:hypothetical protein LSTR_LSTR012095 [Laodelphax striatellus]
MTWCCVSPPFCAPPPAPQGGRPVPLCQASRRPPPPPPPPHSSWPWALFDLKQLSGDFTAQQLSGDFTANTFLYLLENYSCSLKLEFCFQTVDFAPALTSRRLQRLSFDWAADEFRLLFMPLSFGLFTLFAAFLSLDGSVKSGRRRGCRYYSGKCCHFEIDIADIM